MRLSRLGKPQEQKKVRPRRRVSMVDTCTGIEHFVTDESAASGRSAGRYVAACTTVVLPGSLNQDSQRFCAGCRDWATQR